MSDPAFFRMLGGALLVLSGMLLGLRGAGELRMEACALRRLSAALGMLSGELTTRQTPLPDVFQKLRSEKFFALLDAGFGLEPTERLWRRAAEALELESGCAAALADLGAVIGRYDAARQAVEISAVRTRLEERADAVERELASRGRRLPGLGAALGAMAAVLLF